MYRYDIRGGDFKIGEAKKIGKTIAVIVDNDWLGARAVVIKEGRITKYVDDDLDEKEKEILSLLSDKTLRPEHRAEIIFQWLKGEEDEDRKRMEKLQKSVDECIKAAADRAAPFWEGVLYTLDHRDDEGLKEKAIASSQNARKNLPDINDIDIRSAEIPYQ